MTADTPSPKQDINASAIGAEPDASKSNALMRTLWAFAGGICVLLGVIGIALPLLPTVPFLLLAAFCFGRSSQRLHHWLVSHPKLGPPIVSWQRHKAISSRAKMLALMSMAAMLIISALIPIHLYALLAQGTVLTLVAWYIVSRPTPPEEEGSGS